MGWVIVRDVLCIGPWHHEEERSDRHRRSPTDYEAEHVLLRTAKCVQGSAEIHLDCEPASTTAGCAAEWRYSGSGYHEAAATSEGMEIELRLVTDMRLGFEGPRAKARTILQRGRRRVRRARVGRAPAAPDLRGGLRPAGADGALLAGVAQARLVSRPPLAHLPAAQRADAQGTDLRAHGRDGRRRDHLAARDARAASATGTTATAGSATRRSCSGPSTRSASTGRRTTSSTSSPTWPRPRSASSRSCTASAGESKLTEQTLDHLSGYDGARPVRIGNGAYDQNQHDVWGAVLDSIYLHTKSRDQLPERLWPIIKRQVNMALEKWREPDRGIWEVRGEPEALHLLEADVLGRRRPRRAPRADPRGPRRGRRAGRRRRTRSTPTSARTASTRAACSPSTTRPTRSTHRSC